MKVGGNLGDKGKEGPKASLFSSCKLTFSMSLFWVKRKAHTQSQPLFCSTVSGHVYSPISAQQGCLRLPDINNKSHSLMFLTQVWATGSHQDQRTASFTKN